MPSKKRVQRNKEQWLVEFILKHGYVYGAELGVQKGINLKYLVNAIPHLHMIGVDIWADKSVRWDGTKSEDLVHQAENVNTYYIKNHIDLYDLFTTLSIIFPKYYLNNENSKSLFF